ncbi:MAG: DUF72 domain-containing protein [Ferruginibacter sp.]
MMVRRKGIFRIGTSNIVVPGNKQSYPPAFQGKSRLNYYSSFFNSLEINSSFYKIPMPATFEKWSKDVPVHFRFSVKFWKEITHVKELKVGHSDIERFLKAANMLGNKKGCLLVQFPGKIGIEYYNKVEKILKYINEYDPGNKWRVAVEFRNPSWYTGETFELMDEYNTSIVLHDIPNSRNMSVNKKASFIYIRFHGPVGDYRGSYNKQLLQERAVKIKAWLAKGKDVYAYFNNTIGAAFENAISLQKMIND